MLEIGNITKEEKSSRIMLYDNLVKMIDKQIILHQNELDKLARQRANYIQQMTVHEFFRDYKHSIIRGLIDDGNID